MSRCVIADRECPRTNDKNAKQFCPAWSSGVVWSNSQTGEERIVNCAFEALMPALVEVIKASNRPAAAIESTRNELATGFAKVGQVLSVALQLEQHK